MDKDVSQLKSVLALLPAPAFLTDGETVLWSNDACARLPLRRGDALLPLLGKALPLYRERDAAAAAHLTVGVGDTLFEATVQRFGAEDLFLLAPVSETETAQLRAVAAGIRPALSDLMSVGAKLFPFLEEAEDERLQEQTAAMSRACFRLLRTVGALQFFDQVSTSRRAALSQTDLTALLRELADHTADVLQDAKITLRADLPDRPISAYVDGAAIQYAVMQMLAGACARCGDDRTVDLNVAPAGRWLRISVGDHGGAMKADALAAAFSPLSLPDNGGGIGLGLPIARAVAQQHGGSTLIEAGGSGVCVTMTIDLTTPAPSVVRDVKTEYRHGYDMALVEFSGVLPPQTFDTRNVDL